MSDILECGHPTACRGFLAINAAKLTGPIVMGKDTCGWCAEACQLAHQLATRNDRIDDLQRDNQSLRDVLGKKAMQLYPGDHHNLDVREIGYLVMLPGARMHTPDDRTICRMTTPPNADTTAKSERESCPECGNPSEIVSIPFAADAAVTLSCGCKTRNRDWLQRSHAQDKEYYGRQNRIHNEHASKCPCGPCHAGRQWEATK